ncbi:MAG: GGDEF domain-containing protein [bacterium]|nr:GGDEF domain-containing protein [bacterium]
MTATGIQTSLADQMKISEWEANARKKLFEFSEEEVSALISCRTFIGEHVDEIVDAFYKKQTAVREISLLIGDSGTFRRLRASMRQYVAELFDGFYDLEYVNKRLHIGTVHKRIGVSPKFYISAVRLLEDLLRQKIETHFSVEDSHRIEDALHKIILFDVQLIFDAYINSMLAEVESANNQLAEYVASLEETVQERTEQLRDLSRKDALTQLFNQRAFAEDLRREVMGASRHLQSLTLVYFDLNGFKALNDTKGHLAGDQVLVNVGQALLEVTRDTDFPCRYGGMNFASSCPPRMQARPINCASA